MDGFTLAFEGFDPDDEGLREALTSTGNGYLCTRGAAEWEDADGTHYPGTYVHGFYNRETAIFGGRPVLNEDLVNLPNWLVLKLRIEDEDAIRLADVEVLDLRHEIDVRHATVHRHVRFRDRAGRVTALASRRFVSMADIHHAGIEWTVVPEGWSGRIQIVTAIDGRVVNRNVARYGQLPGRHLSPVAARTRDEDVIALKAVTRQSDLLISQAARTRVMGAAGPVSVPRSTYQTRDYIQQVLDLEVRAGEPTCVEKMVAIWTSRDPAVGDTLEKSARSAARYLDFGGAWERHLAAWRGLWGACDLSVTGPDRVQLLLRLHASHLLQVCSRHTADIDAGLPARGLNGEAYRGHVFWDELFVLPFLSLRLPEVVRGLLMYRYRRLPEARAAATEEGYRGAMYPWQSGSEGTEETQRVHLNPLSGRWDVDLSHHQRHVGAAVFFNVWRYVQATDDRAFLSDHGAEMLLEIARFWASLAHYSPERERYEIHGVMGPDEFHEKYPDAPEAGLRNNAYTNVLVAWLCGVAGEVLPLLPEDRAHELRQRLGITDDELATWDDMSRRMYVPFHGDGIISQFEGYGDLEELDWDGYRERYGNIQRLDRILRAEDDDPDRYMLSKQADAVMLYFLFSSDELAAIFGRLGYDHPDDLARRTVEHYDHRTSHGSTLSFVTHAGVLAEFDVESSWERFLVALESDVGDIQGGTTKEGIHLGVMAGTLDLVQHRYAGVTIDGDTLRLAPRLPAALEGISFPMRFRGASIHISVRAGEVTVSVDDDEGVAPVAIAVDGDRLHLGPGETATLGQRPAGTSDGSTTS
ncbi:glycoside hydrolase family 65 protein [Iamia sp. SCSIO 61187]|uniref:glycoside hydrolase family 65 protein n=1 Tax=Iamia sp. SCSIO 61187 TaxID=2722752 RepID=UPI001C62B684|nr:glycosyl hydrolase family 65 protein [Iamia sp. SCSIO 61187]QYG93540.1 glycoside hydrolase family 65 protein [Iamia sp. SCSIO 61187]